MASFSKPPALKLLFVDFLQEYNYHIKVAELTSQTTFSAFPSEEYQNHIISCLSVRIDSKNRLWILDYAQHGIRGNPKLIAFKLDETLTNPDHSAPNAAVPDSQKATPHDVKVIEYSFPKAVAGFGSMLNDFVIDPSGAFVYIVDTSIIATTPALLVYSVQHNNSARMLSAHESMFGESLFLNVFGKYLIRFGPFGLKINADSLALDRKGDFLYYGPLTSSKLFRISTSHILTYMRLCFERGLRTLPSSMHDNLPSFVERVNVSKPVTDGLTTDALGNIWFTGVEQGAIYVGTPTKNPAIDPDAKEKDKGVAAFSTTHLHMRKVVESESLLRWPDGFSFGPRGLYVSASVLHVPFARLGKVQQFAPYHIMRLGHEALERVLGMEDVPLPLPGQ